MPETTEAESEHYPWRQMKPNKMFPEEIRALIRGYVAAKGEKLPPCPVCNKKTRGRWTMLCPFIPHDLGQFQTIPHPVQRPLTLVCSDHPISPDPKILNALAF